MKKIALSSLVLIGLLFFSLPAESQESYYPFSYARLSYVQGDVRVDRGNDLGVEAGEVNLALVTGDKVMTEDGLTEISFGRNNFLRLDNYSIVEIARLPESESDDFSLHLYQGRAYLRISHLSKEKAFSLHTPDASFYILENGLYRFEVKEPRGTEVTVFEGSLEASGQDEAILLEAGESASASEGYLLETAGNGYFDSDDFSIWNSERDDLILRASSQSSSYLPEEIREYEPELSSYGRWVYERPYGYVWVPAITYVDWRPYLIGRWVWYPRIGWTWVSAEPWGWVVYHYGRWHWRLGLGWYWIPTVHWGPAWVHWYWDAEFVAWCPLSYWNRPLVIINNYVYERYNENYYPVHSRALVMVRRNQLQAPHSARTLVRPEQLRGVEKIRLEARQPQIRPVVKTNLKPVSSSLNVPAIGSSSNFSKYGERIVQEHKLKSISSGVSSANSENRPLASSAGLTEKKISREKMGGFPSRIRRENQNLRTARPSIPSSTISRNRLNQNNSEQSKAELGNNLNTERQKIRIYPEKPATTLRQENNQSLTRERSPNSRLREFVPSSRSKSNNRSPSLSYPEKSPAKATWQNQERKSSSFNLPSLSRPYSQPSVRNRNDNDQNRSFSPGRISQSQPVKPQAPSSYGSSHSIRKKNG
ncbi:MAG: hypothetical protein H5U06_06760 [Candidatus Aminicenantes bacterium]|nr:hypothetical protein [Candidatus Aminicenantes bacterium]